jgi:serine/threonine protein kinase
MGRVYRARDRKFDVEVALKRLRTDVKESELGVRRFWREASAIKRLNHQNIVRVEDVGEDDEGPYIVMEWVEGCDLAEMIRDRGKLELREALELFRWICSAVGYAHQHSVIHRDIKPQNILLTEDGVPKLVDFGLARVGSDSSMSVSGVGMGTLAYVAPEQRADAKSADHKSDIFSLGKVLYCMLTGETPEVVYAEAIPERVRPQLLKAIKSSPAARYFSVDEFVRALDSSPDPQQRTAKPGPTHPAADPPVCPVCATGYGSEDRFCQKCGKDLFLPCSVEGCSGELRLGSAHCPACGLDASSAAKYNEQAHAAEEALQGARLRDAQAAADAMLAMRRRDPAAREVLADIDAAIRKRDELLASARALLEQGKYIEARIAAKAAGDVDVSDNQAPELMGLVGQRERAHRIRVLLDEVASHRAQGRLDEAVECARELLAIDRGNAGGVRVLRELDLEVAKRKQDAGVASLVSKARAEVERRHWAEACKWAEQALDMRPDNDEARAILDLAGYQSNMRFYRVLWVILLIIFGGIVVVQLVCNASPGY